MKTVVTFGELLLRLTPPNYSRLVQAVSYQASFGGGEANVAVSLANYGLHSVYVTRLPENEIGLAAVQTLRGFGVDVSRVLRGGQRMGLYFLEKGASQRPSKVVYDRAGSAFATAQVGDFPWDEIFRQADWFHFTGITPALSESAAELCLQACQTAKAYGVTVSCDLNYRKNLWSRQQAREVMGRLMPYVDVCIANEEDIGDVFDLHAAQSDIQQGKLSQQGYEKVAAALAQRFPLKKIAITLRVSHSASDNGWGGMLYTEGKSFFSRSYQIHLVDRVGGGDSFAGGLIYSLLAGKNDVESLEFAVAASCLKQTIEGDFNLVTVEEVQRLAQGDASGRVQR